MFHLAQKCCNITSSNIKIFPILSSNVLAKRAYPFVSHCMHHHMQETKLTNELSGCKGLPVRKAISQRSRNLETASRCSVSVVLEVIT